MSALNNLSVVSNMLQVVGFADTVFRVGQNLYELVDKARSASRNIALLLLELQALLSVVAYVRVYISEHSSSPFAQDDGHTLPNIHTILTLIEQDFRHLRGLLAQTVGSGRESWLWLFQSNVRWALKDHEIAASRHRLAQYTQNLTAALSVSGRRNDIVLRTRLQSIEDRLQAISQSNPPPRLDPEVDITPPSIRTTFRVPRRLTRATYTTVQPRNRPQSPVRVDLTPARRTRRKARVITPDTAGFHDPFISNICPKFNVYEDANQTLLLDTGNYALDQITKPTMLLQDSLVAFFDAIRTNYIAVINEVQVKHLQMLFDLFLGSAYAASAEAVMKKYHNGSDTELLDRDFPAGKWRGAAVRKREIRSSSIANRLLPAYLEEKSLSLDTNVGSVKAKILSARSCTDSIILAFAFEYLGNAKVGLSPFEVHFMSHMLGTYFPFQKPIDTRGSMETEPIVRSRWKNTLIWGSISLMDSSFLVGYDRIKENYARRLVFLSI